MTGNSGLNLMHNSALFATLLFVLCAVPFVLVVDARGQSTTPDAQRVEPTAAPTGHARPTKEQNLASCMALWEPETHMTKKLWKTVCKRLETKD